MFKRILIANRGEIACRIIKTAHRMGIECVAVYSTADQNSRFVAMADYAYCIGEPQASESYLSSEKIIAAALDSGAQAVHPGYGFLSENSEFASACAAAGIVFIGPSVSAMEAMASKQLAKQLLEKTTVPLTPGYHGKDQADQQLLQEAIRIGFPVLLKAANGGGGKGMRTVNTQAEFQQALDSARREAKAYFTDDTMIIEKYIGRPRHVEIQIMADNFGHVVHLFERDCSIQRRHQKIVEEAPAPNLSERLRQCLAQAAIDVAKAIDYRGAGTIEFLVDENEQFYFMEMNTRLQVEHPVTEMITGIDLVEWQLRIAANEPLPLAQDVIKAHGHAIECRIYAEDPAHDNLPSTGTIHFLQEPSGEGLRIDTGIHLKASISPYYDSMVAKLIAYGETRDQAIQRLLQALKHYAIGGVKTNIPLLAMIIGHPQFEACQLSTHFLAENTVTLPKLDLHRALMIAASVDYLKLNPTPAASFYTDTFAWQMHLKSQWTWRYCIDGETHTVLVTPVSPKQLTVTYQEFSTPLTIHGTEHGISLNDGQHIQQVAFDECEAQITLYLSSGNVDVKRFRWQKQTNAASGNHQLTSPMPATVVAVLKQRGENIKIGDRLMILEAMKMEHTILAPQDGVISDIFYQVGEQVNEGAELMALSEPTLHESQPVQS